MLRVAVAAAARIRLLWIEVAVEAEAHPARVLARVSALIAYAVRVLAGGRVEEGDHATDRHEITHGFLNRITRRALLMSFGRNSMHSASQTKPGLHAPVW